MNRWSRIVSLFVWLAVFAGPRVAQSQKPGDSTTVNAALQHYARLVKLKAVDSISKMFRPEGELVNQGQKPIVGADRIQFYLLGFQKLDVLSHVMKGNRMVFRGDTVIQSGTFEQRVKPPKGEAFTARGTFEITWWLDQRIGGVATWVIRRMVTAPADAK